MKLIFLVFIFLFHCRSTEKLVLDIMKITPRGESFVLEKSNTQKATIYFFRTLEMPRGLDNTEIWVDGKVIEILGPGTYTVAYHEPGELDMEVSTIPWKLFGIPSGLLLSHDKTTITLDLKAGESYFVKINYVVPGVPFMTPVPWDFAKKEIVNYKASKMILLPEKKTE